MLLFLLHPLLASVVHASVQSAAPVPPPWPNTFHLVSLNTRNTSLALVDLWYDWPKGRNLNLIASQLTRQGVLHDVEYNNHTSFYFDLGKKTCRLVKFDVGILRPDWLTGATYNGVEVVDNITTHSFTQGDGFVTYWYEVDPPHRPVRWTFFDNATSHIMSWHEGEVLADEEWQAPSYCFNTAAEQGSSTVPEGEPTEGMGRLTPWWYGSVASSGGGKGQAEEQLEQLPQAEEAHLGWYWRTLAAKLEKQQSLQSA